MDDDADGGVFHPYLAVVLGLIDDIDLLSSAPYLSASGWKKICAVNLRGQRVELVLEPFVYLQVIWLMVQALDKNIHQ